MGRDIHTNISYYKYNMNHAIIKLVCKYLEARLRMRSCPPLGFVGHWTYARRDIHTNISHYKYNMYETTIKRGYKYSEDRLMLQSLSPLDLLGLRARQGGSSIQTYHTTNIICTKQQSNLFTSILRLDLWCKACPPWICWALEVRKEVHSYKHITLQI